MNDEPKRKARGWLDDEFARHEVFSQWWWLVVIFVAGIAGFLLPAISNREMREAHLNRWLVLYCAQDQVFAEPLLKDFEKETGIKVKAVFDSEAVKTVGLANRLIAERSHPQADVFWGNEEFRTRQLVEQGVLTNGFTPLAGYHRLRQIVINTNLVKLDAAPRSLADLTNSIWRGKVALAYPLFGTTATHFLALRQSWGEARWLEWCRALVVNKALVVDGNSVVVKLVGRGEAWVGLTDSDDIAAFQREGLPIAAINFADTLRIPNTAAIITGAPHPENAAKLVAFLNRDDIKRRLADANAFAPVKPEDPIGLRADWDALLRDQENAVAQLKEIFLR